MKEKVKTILVKIKFLVQRVEELKLNIPDYEVMNRLRAIELKVDELSDLLSELEEMGE